MTDAHPPRPPPAGSLDDISVSIGRLLEMSASAERARQDTRDEVRALNDKLDLVLKDLAQVKAELQRVDASTKTEIARIDEVVKSMAPIVKNLDATKTKAAGVLMVVSALGAGGYAAGAELLRKVISP